MSCNGFILSLPRPQSFNRKVTQLSRDTNWWIKMLNWDYSTKSIQKRSLAAHILQYLFRCSKPKQLLSALSTYMMKKTFCVFLCHWYSPNHSYLPKCLSHLEKTLEVFWSGTRGFGYLPDYRSAFTEQKGCLNWSALISRYYYWFHQLILGSFMLAPSAALRN